MIRLILLMLTAFFSQLISAYEVSPMYLELEDRGKKTQNSYTITNPEEYSIAVEATVFKMERDADNVETLTPAEDEFLILPPQAIVKANQSQLFRVRFMPSGPIDKTVTYRVIFTQLEFEDDVDEESNVTMLLEFATLVFVSPVGSTPDAKVTFGKDHSLIVKNTGSRVLDLSTLNFTLSGKNQTVVTWNNLNRGRYSDYVMPSRTMTYEFPEALNSIKSISVSND